MDSDNSLKIDRYKRYVNPYWVNVLNSLGLPLVYEKAEGEYLYDENDEGWLDFVGSYGAATIGHNNKQIITEIINHLSRSVPAIFPWGINALAGKLAQKLVELSPINDGKVVFLNSGSEAIETAVKLSFCETGRQRVLAFNNGFHGLTMLSSHLNGHDVWRRNYCDGFDVADRIDVGSISVIEECLASKKYACLVLEVVQNIGGGFVWSSEQLLSISKLCNLYGTKLVVDEVLTGLGRTGTMFASEILAGDLAPDAIVLSKGLSSSLVPMSAVICKNELHQALFGKKGNAKIHGTTFSGNSLSACVALSTIDYLEKMNILANVKEVSQLFRLSLKKIQEKYGLIENVGGLGLYVSISFYTDFGDLSAYCFQQFAENKILINFSSHKENTIILIPPLDISVEKIDYFILVFDAILCAYLD